MATSNLTRVSPGLYRNNRGDIVRQGPSRTSIPRTTPTAVRTTPPPVRGTTPANTGTTTTSTTVTRAKPGVTADQRAAGQTSQGATTEQVTTQQPGQQQQQNQQQQQDRDPNRVRGRIDWLKKRIPVAGTTPPPAGMRPDNVPTYNLLTEQERRQFLGMRAKDPRGALRWAQQQTADRSKDAGELKTLQDWLTNFEASQNQNQTPPPPPPGDQGQPPPPPPPPPPGDEPPANNTADPLTTEFDGNYQSPMSKALMEAFNNVNNTLSAYEPKFFEGSPMYQFQKQKGMADLEKLMAARGLTGSGAEIQGNSDFLANINATEAEKQRQYAEAERDRRQRGMEFIANYDRTERDALRDQWNRNLDRQQNISEFEATRGDRRQEAAINFLNNVLGMQSQNDIARIAQGGQASQTQLTQALMQMIGNNIMSQVPRATGGGGGGAPPPPPGNNAAIYENLIKYGNSAGNNDLFNSILRLFG